MKKKGIIVSLLTIALIIILATFSYAYWRLTYTATKVNKIVSSCFSMELTNEKNNIVLDDSDFADFRAIEESWEDSDNAFLQSLTNGVGDNGTQ